MLRRSEVLVLALEGEVFAVENHDGRAHMRRLETAAAEASP